MSKAKRGRDKFNKFKPLINLLVGLYSVFPRKARKILFEHYRMTKGLKGLVLRYALLKSIALKCGNNVSVHPGVYLFRPENLSIGDNVSIHPMCYIDAEGGIKIGNDVSIAHGVTVMSTSHSYNKLDVPIKDQEVLIESTHISDNVWIGAKATILSGKTLNTGCVIAANCVVTKDVESNVIVGGIPNKVLKQR